jgi:hypothetical protein
VRFAVIYGKVPRDEVEASLLPPGWRVLSDHAGSPDGVSRHVVVCGEGPEIQATLEAHPLVTFVRFYRDRDDAETAACAAMN